MKQSLAITCLFGLVLLGSAAAQDEAEVITITKKPLPVGAVVSEGLDGKMSMEQTVAVGGNVMQTTKMSGTMVGKRRWTVLERDDKGVSKVKLHVIEKKETMTGSGGPMGDMEESDVSPLSGNTYTITRTADGLDITAEGDVEVTGDMRSEIRDAIHEETASLLSPSNGLEKLVGRNKFTVGEAVTLDKKDLENFMGGDNDAKFPISSITFTPKGSRTVLGADCIVFDVEAAVADDSTEPGTPAMSARFSGEAVVRKAGGWLQSLDLSGPITVDLVQDQDGMTIEVDGRGTMEMKLLTFFEIKQQ